MAKMRNKTKTVNLQKLKHKKPSKKVQNAKKDSAMSGMSRKERERALENEPM